MPREGGSNVSGPCIYAIPTDSTVLAVSLRMIGVTFSTTAARTMNNLRGFQHVNFTACVFEGPSEATGADMHGLDATTNACQRVTAFGNIALGGLTSYILATNNILKAQIDRLNSWNTIVLSPILAIINLIGNNPTVAAASSPATGPL
ncbi:hypothetical protein [Deinococcus aerophilus]|uniref:Uncharacterized protein n=1 Tax=Deinococcus aerophilus TaxID=522488 RepID=A0ABQ2GU05_9DEIO|nr:hypothetical protein [Deinococcus aerophilus]GGM13221.1 hypothetical protein GCM10010841_22310 [Deinococcus aerophilus]